MSIIKKRTLSGSSPYVEEVYILVFCEKDIPAEDEQLVFKRRLFDYFSGVYRKKPYNGLSDLPTLYRRKSLLKTTFWASIEVWLLVFFWRPLSGQQSGPYWRRLLILYWSFWFSIGHHLLVFHWRPPPGLLWKKKTIWSFVEEDQVFYERRAVSIEDYLLVF